MHVQGPDPHSGSRCPDVPGPGGGAATVLLAYSCLDLLGRPFAS